MKKIVKLNENDLKKIVSRVIKEYDEKMTTTGKYYTLGGFYFYVNEGQMYLAEKQDGELSPKFSVEFPSTKEISAEWSNNTQETDDPNIKGKELKGLSYDTRMKNAVNYGKDVYKKNEAIVNFGSMTPIIFFSQKFGAPTLGGFVVSTDFAEGVEGKLTTIEGKLGNKIYFQQSSFKAGKEYGITLEVSMHGQPISLEDFGITKTNLKLPKIYNVGDFFDENESNPKQFEKASFLEGIKDYIKGGGKINKVTIDASTSKIPAGHVDNDESKGHWKELNEYDDVVMGNNDDGTGNLQLCKHKAIKTYEALKQSIPELASAPYVLKASGPVGEYVHIKFE
jgi:hypothetical protein